MNSAASWGQGGELVRINTFWQLTEQVVKQTVKGGLTLHHQS